MVKAYGEEGRAFYRMVELTADVLYPLSYTLFFGALLSAVLRRAFPATSIIQRLALIPAVTFLFDQAENAGIITMLSQFPAESVLVAQVSNFFTIAKWAAFGAIIVILLFGLGALLVRRFTRQPAGRVA
jgi:hypothetical protein